MIGDDVICPCTDYPEDDPPGRDSIEFLRASTAGLITLRSEHIRHDDPGEDADGIHVDGDVTNVPTAPIRAGNAQCNCGRHALDRHEISPCWCRSHGTCQDGSGGQGPVGRNRARRELGGHHNDHASGTLLSPTGYQAKLAAGSSFQMTKLVMYRLLPMGYLIVISACMNSRDAAFPQLHASWVARMATSAPG